MSSFKTYSFEEAKVGLHKSRSLKQDANKHEIGDNVLLVVSDNPTSKPVPQQTERKSIGGLKRNPVKRVGSMTSEVSAKTYVTDDFTNTRRLFIESTIGRLEFSYDSDQVPYTSTVASPLVARCRENVNGKVYSMYINHKTYSVTGTGGTTNALATALASAYDSDAITGLSYTVSNDMVVFSAYDYSIVEDFDTLTEGLTIGYDVIVSTNATLLLDMSRNETKAQPIVFLDTDDNPLQVAFIYSRNGNNLNLVDKIFPEVLAVGSGIKIAPLVWVNMDNRPDAMLDCLFQRACGIDEDGVAFGSKNEKVVDLLGTSEFTLEHGEEIQIANTYTGGDFDLIEPNVDGQATPDFIQSVAHGTFRDPVYNFPRSTVDPAYTYVVDEVGTLAEGKLYLFITKTSELTGIQTIDQEVIDVEGSDTPATVAGKIVTALNGVYCTASNVDEALTCEVKAMETLHIYSSTDSADVALIPTMTALPDGVLDSNRYDIAIPSAGLTGAQSLTVYLNGIDFTVNGALTDEEIANALALLINADNRFRAHAVIGTTDYVRVELTDKYDTLSIDFHGDITPTYTQLSAGKSTPAGDTPAFFFLTRLRVGTAGLFMENFCDTDSVSLEFSRTIQQIKTVCTRSGNAGVYNADYTLFMSINAKDTDVDKVYKYFKKFKDNGDFSICGYNSELGVSFFFPKCSIEEWSGDENSDEQIATMYKVNINFDPRKTPILVLPQKL